MPRYKVLWPRVQILVGEPRQQRSRGHLVDSRDLLVEAAFLAQLRAQKADRRIVRPLGEVEQNAVRAEVCVAGRIQILDGRIGAAPQQGDPVIIGAHMHAALVRADHHRGLADSAVGRIIAPLGARAIEAADVHAVCPWSLMPCLPFCDRRGK